MDALGAAHQFLAFKEQVKPERVLRVGGVGHGIKARLAVG
jgi:hypothetical protein